MAAAFLIPPTSYCPGYLPAVQRLQDDLPAVMQAASADVRGGGNSC
jgi:hypothetical protein